MREIKFRAWDKENFEFIDFLSSDIRCEYDGNSFSILCFNSGDGWTPERGEFNDPSWDKLDCELMQYTGLKDKNDVEIYEGDIVKYQHQKYDKEPRISVIEYNNTLCGFTINSKYFSSLDTSIQTIEVIGNIYENEELLEGH